ncbi:MAG: 50S ribosomal protein L31 [Nitrosopumilus sp.]|nr:MAG: 50S ribosomal protein L31 [Nitrosopumilus sp.]
MSQEVERVYTIPLGKVLLSQSQHRAVRAINMIKEFARHHMKVEDIKIEEDLAHKIWSKGIRSPPRKIRVRMSKTDEGYVLVSPYEEGVESEVTPAKETPKVEDKVEEPTKEESKVEAQVEEPEAETKVEDKVEEPKKEEVPAKEETTSEDKVEESPKETPAKEEPKKEEKE